MLQERRGVIYECMQERRGESHECMNERGWRLINLVSAIIISNSNAYYYIFLDYITIVNLVTVIMLSHPVFVNLVYTIIEIL